jgi:flagellar basal body-associated protein FliL
VAEEKDTPEPAPAPAAKKKVPAIALVAVGAALGGAGVVFLAPAPAPVAHGPTEPEIVSYEHPDAMEFTFNPQVKRGYKTALVSLKFVYEADRKLVEGDAAHAGEGGAHDKGAPEAAAPLPPVPNAIRTYWNRATSRCYEVLSNQDVDTLTSPDGKKYLKRLLIDELGASLFPDGQARVVDVYLMKIFVQ